MLNVEVYYDETTPFTAIKLNHSQISPHSKLRKFQNMHLEEWVKDLFLILHKECNEEEMQICFHGSAVYYDAIQREAEKFSGTSRVKLYLQHVDEQQESLSRKQKIGELIWCFESELSVFPFIYTTQLRKKLEQILYQYNQKKYLNCCDQMIALSEDLARSLHRRVFDLENNRINRRQVYQDYKKNQALYRELIAFTDTLQQYQWKVNEQTVYKIGIDKTTRTFEELRAGKIQFDQRDRIIKKIEACQYDIFSDFAMLCDIQLKQEVEALQHRYEETVSSLKELQTNKIRSIFHVKGIAAEGLEWKEEKDLMTWLANAENELIDRIETAVCAIQQWKEQTMQNWLGQCREYIEEIKRMLLGQKEAIEDLEREIKQTEEFKSVLEILRRFNQQWIELGRSL